MISYTQEAGTRWLASLASLGDWKCWTDTRLQVMAGIKPHVHLHWVKQYR